MRVYCLGAGGLPVEVEGLRVILGFQGIGAPQNCGKSRFLIHGVRPLAVGRPIVRFLDSLI